MTHAAPAPAQVSPRQGARPRWISLVSLLALGLFVAAMYASSDRASEWYDTEASAILTWSLARGEGPYLDRFGPFLREPDGRLRPFVDRAGGHLVSRYPIAPAVLALPVAVSLYAIQDRIFPGWDRDPFRARVVVLVVGRLSAIALVVSACVVQFALLRRIGRPGTALGAALIVALGSEYWAVASQALWQHGPAALMLTLAMLALLPPDVTRSRAVLGGIATGLMIACRLTDLIPALAILGFMAAHHRRRLGWFLAGPVVIGSLLVSYNYWFFGNLIGGQKALEAMHPQLHGVPGPWSGHLLEGLAGTLFSPSRGLFVYCPWVALSVAVLPWTFRRLRPWPVLVWLTAALVPMLLMLSQYAVWWAGHSFGPHYWTDLTPSSASCWRSPSTGLASGPGSCCPPWR